MDQSPLGPCAVVSNGALSMKFTRIDHNLFVSQAAQPALFFAQRPSPVPASRLWSIGVSSEVLSHLQFAVDIIGHICKGAPLAGIR